MLFQKTFEYTETATAGAYKIPGKPAYFYYILYIFLETYFFIIFRIRIFLQTSLLREPTDDIKLLSSTKVAL